MKTMTHPTSTSIKLRDFAPYARQRTKWDLLKKWLYFFFGYILVSVGLFGMLMVFPVLFSSGSTWMSLSLIVAFILSGGGLLRFGRSYGVDAKKIILTDARDPILFLRSFQHDPDKSLLMKKREPTFKSVAKNPEGVITSLLEAEEEDSARSGFRFDQKTDEEVLVSVLNDVGPVVAVGRPGDKIPLPGAIRLHFSNEEWKEKVKTLISISRLVIFQAGFSEGLEWELSTGKELLKPEQIILSLASSQQLSLETLQVEYSLFKARIDRTFNVVIPDQPGDIFFLYFDHGWTVKSSSVKMWKRYLFGWQSTSIIREALRPILADQHIILPYWKTILYTSVRLIIMATLLSLVSLLSLLALLYNLSE